MKYIKQLDSLRAIAVILVIIHHWIPKSNIINKLPNGPIGVDIFFVLSGFLITKILLDNKQKAEQLNLRKSILFRNFYVRRSLRIFPIYYLTIFVLLMFNKFLNTDIKSAFPYLVTYTSNFYFYKIQSWSGIISHMWSLAVEEQFYLIWPWLILLVKRKYILPVIVGFIFIGILGQYLFINFKFSNVLTFNCFDAFGIGALLSWQLTYNLEKINRFYLITSVCAGVALLLFIAGLIQNQWSVVPLRTLISIIALWIITYIVLNSKSDNLKGKFILNNRVLIFIGKISYGIYLYHNIIPATLNALIINKYVNPLLPDFLYKTYSWYLILTENAILLIIISWSSYVLIEKPFLNFKKYFEYEKGNHLQRSKVIKKETIRSS